MSRYSRQMWRNALITHPDYRTIQRYKRAFGSWWREAIFKVEELRAERHDSRPAVRQRYIVQQVGKKWEVLGWADV